MCRLIVFKGTCPHCCQEFTWDELSQELSCLEAKNNGTFALCQDGASVDEKPHDQECDACTAELEEDEGYDDGVDEETIEVDTWYGSKKEAVDDDQESDKHRNKKQRVT
ncbi:uncharacterized protein C8A04DRAFT_40328 [Dichotomopilus funicola]|uniref:Uncharacterized protein n=1 Tax=Dichotomopilus funicola TaxID=1934379 RepID=A0AAN6ZI03_9PEZI|nr:hypothetical protein C8A04DRAFT_40328 [Dichotomopilus funicola]